MNEISHLLQRCQQDNGDGDETHIGEVVGEDFQVNSKLFDNLVIADKTRVHLITSETTFNSMTWKHPSSPVIEKLEVARSAAKVKNIVL
ncbi:hypothetical protein ElyMa_006202600 [Elysia marginata]|uniref:Uncharacterized protein n=1 Tax=Elysia marginata TaxID=1093978 RepID=A0AAV4H4C9_9GAST|nr:hypothetical protein ElyMa_006202600 [Elysia marginata]